MGGLASVRINNLNNVEGTELANSIFDEITLGATKVIKDIIVREATGGIRNNSLGFFFFWGGVCRFYRFECPLVALRWVSDIIISTPVDTSAETLVTALHPLRRRHCSGGNV